MTRKRSSSLNMIVIIISLTMVAKIIGLLRDTFIGQKKLGAGFDSDVYFQGISLTTLIFLGIGSAIATNIIPLVVRYKKEGTNSKSIGRILGLIIVSTLVIGVAYYIFAPWIVALFSPGYSDVKLGQTILMVRIMIPTVLFICTQYFFVGVLQANEQFVLPAVTSFPFNILYFVFLAIGIEKYGVVGLAVVTTVGWMIQLLCLVPAVIKNAYIPLSLGISLKDLEVRKYFLGILPIIIVTLTHHFNIILDNLMASKFDDGSVSSIYFGNLMFTAVVTTTVYGITAVMFPKFNAKFLEDNKDGLFQSVINVLRSIILLLLPMSVGMILVGPHIISLVFERGLFDASDTLTTVVAFTGYTSFMLAFGFVDVLNKAYYTLGIRKIPLMISGLVIIINLLANYILTDILGFGGIAASTSLAFYIGAIVSFYLFYRQNSGFKLDRFVNTLWKALLSALVMGIGVYGINQVLIEMIQVNGLGRLLIMAIDIMFGVIIYGLSLIIVKEQLVSHAVKQLKNRILRSRE